MTTGCRFRRLLAVSLLALTVGGAGGGGAWAGAPVQVAPDRDAPAAAQAAPREVPAKKPPSIKEQRAALRKELAARRTLMIQRLREYREAGVFPHQQSSSFARVSVLVDERGRWCAVAHLMAADGLGDILLEAAAQNNCIKFADVHEGPFHDWILRSGLTLEEIAAIQLPYDRDPGNDPRFESRERARIQKHLAAMEKRLTKNTKKSLDLAVDRLLPLS
jgi:hypothetical protein